jgi:hypothetical protein
VRLDPRLIACALALGALGCKRSADDVAPSQKLRVQAKSGVVWARDLAVGLGLEEWDLCRELGTADCVQDAHLITLGGVEAERLGVDRPLANASVSAPMAVDRVAASACGRRFDLDLSGPAVLFGAVIDDVDKKKHREEVAELLIRRLLARHPTEDDVTALVDFYDQLPSSSDPARDWSIGACLIVATSTEALFY